MKSALLLSLIVCLVESGLPVAAQERVDSPTGPIRQAIIREAAELAADYSAIDSSTQQRGGDDWSRVRNLPPGTKIIVTVRGSPPAQRSFLAADEFALTVADPTIDKIARTDIIEISRPERRQIGRWIKRGEVIGLGVGLATAAAIDATRPCPLGDCNGKFLVLIFYPLMGVMVGGAVGALIGATNQGVVEVIYRAP